MALVGGSRLALIQIFSRSCTVAVRDVHGSELKVLASVHRRLLGRRLGLGSRRVALRGKEAATGVSATPTTLSMARFEQGTCVGVCVFGRACAA